MTNIIKHDDDFFGNSLGKMSAMRNQMDRLVDSFFGGSSNPFTVTEWNTSVPKINIQETDNTVIVTADVPGYHEDDIDVEVSDGYIRISGEHSSEHESGKKEGSYYRYERSSGSFSRIVGLPARTSSDNITADVENGVLTVTIPKRLEENKTKVKVSKKK